MQPLGTKSSKPVRSDHSLGVEERQERLNNLLAVVTTQPLNVSPDKIVMLPGQVGLRSS